MPRPAGPRVATNRYHDDERPDTTSARSRSPSFAVSCLETADRRRGSTFNTRRPAAVAGAAVQTSAIADGSERELILLRDARRSSAAGAGEELRARVAYPARAGAAGVPGDALHRHSIGRVLRDTRRKSACPEAKRSPRATEPKTRMSTGSGPRRWRSVARYLASVRRSVSVSSGSISAVMPLVPRSRHRRFAPA